MKNLILLLLVFIFIGCKKETTLNDSVFIADKENPNLPAYTEWGYNTFGANYERDVFTYTEYDIPIKVIIENDELNLLFQGDCRGCSGDLTTLKFVLPRNNIEKYQDLLAFNDTIIDLTRQDISVHMLNEYNERSLDIIEGELTFKRSQKVFVDDEEKEIILSGYFNLKFLVNGVPENMSDGRFDLGIGDNNFYNLDEL